MQCRDALVKTMILIESQSGNTFAIYWTGSLVKSNTIKQQDQERTDFQDQ